ESEPKRAAPWNTKPVRLRTASIASSRMRSMRVPKRDTSPESARINPLVILSRTVLPAPLPPMTARVVPLRRARLTPRRTSFCSKDFRTSESSTRQPAAWVISPPENEEQLGQAEVGDDHGHRALDHL